MGIPGIWTLSAREMWLAGTRLTPLHEKAPARTFVAQKKERHSELRGY